MTTKTGTRVLAAIASYGMRNDHYLLHLAQEYLSMAFDVDIVLLTNISKQLAPRECKRSTTAFAFPPIRGISAGTRWV